MAIWDKLDAALQNTQATAVYYIASTEEALLREAARRVCDAFEKECGEVDTTVVPGPTPDMGAIIEAAGTLSLFGTRRLVLVQGMMPSAMNDKDVDELCTLFGQLENAVMVVTSLYKDKKTGTTQKGKRLFEAAKQHGFAAEMAKPGRADNMTALRGDAAALGAQFGPGAAETLLERAGEDRLLLQNEVVKLAAMSGYTTITKELVEAYSVANIEADVFELARYITSGRKASAYKKLQQLFALRHEPIAVAAALSGTFVDMYRVRVGSEQRLPVAAIFKEMGYKGNDYRLQKAKENAARYTTPQLEACVTLLYRLDTSLKSTAVGDKDLLVCAAVGQLMQMGAAR